jgi:hypothetical protein
MTEARECLLLSLRPEKNLFVAGKYCEFAGEFYATITAKQPKIA